MLFSLFLLACQDEMDQNWIGTCHVEGRNIDVELEFDEQAWDILQGTITFSERASEGSGDFGGTRSADDIELDFMFDANDYVWRGLWVGELDGNDMEAEVTFTGSEYSTSGDCTVNED